MLDHSIDGEVLLKVGEEVRNNLMESMDEQSLVVATKGLDVDDHGSSRRASNCCKASLTEWTINIEQGLKP